MINSKLELFLWEGLNWWWWTYPLFLRQSCTVVRHFFINRANNHICPKTGPFAGPIWGDGSFTVFFERRQCYWFSFQLTQRVDIRFWRIQTSAQDFGLRKDSLQIRQFTQMDPTVSQIVVTGGVAHDGIAVVSLRLVAVVDDSWSGCLRDIFVSGRQLVVCALCGGLAWVLGAELPTKSIVHTTINTTYLPR